MPSSDILQILDINFLLQRKKKLEIVMICHAEKHLYGSICLSINLNKNETIFCPIVHGEFPDI